MIELNDLFHYEKSGGTFFLDDKGELVHQSGELGDEFNCLGKKHTKELFYAMKNYYEPNNNWISVDDRLPVDTESVLIYYKSNYEDLGNLIKIGYYDEWHKRMSTHGWNNGWALGQRGATYYLKGIVTHWQPLPRAPEGV